MSNLKMTAYGASTIAAAGATAILAYASRLKYLESVDCWRSCAPKNLLIDELIRTISSDILQEEYSFVIGAKIQNVYDFGCRECISLHNFHRAILIGTATTLLLTVYLTYQTWLIYNKKTS